MKNKTKLVLPILVLGFILTFSSGCHQTARVPEIVTDTTTLSTINTPTPTVSTIEDNYSYFELTAEDIISLSIPEGFTRPQAFCLEYPAVLRQPYRSTYDNNTGFSMDEFYRDNINFRFPSQNVHKKTPDVLYIIISKPGYCDIYVPQDVKTI